MVATPLQMNLAACYRVLGLRSGASLADVKLSYRRLARQLHPDANPGDQGTQDGFIQLNRAYSQLLAQLSLMEEASLIRIAAANRSVRTDGRTKSRPEPQSAHQAPSQARTQSAPRSNASSAPDSANREPRRSATPLTAIDQQLKQQTYQQLQLLLRSQRFPRAIALIEGLAQRIPDDVEVRQWQAITYQRWARQLMRDKQFDKARVYLKKTLKTDPHNKTLWSEVEKEFQQLEQWL
jgi:curved DNA-binding protein CbpA